MKFDLFDEVLLILTGILKRTLIHRRTTGGYCGITATSTSN